jgi:acyl transferase domain-containing protein
MPAIQTACSTSLVAAVSPKSAGLARARHGAGGRRFDSFPQKRGYLYQEGAMVSAMALPPVRCGCVRRCSSGVGAACAAADALEAHDQIIAVIKGGRALNNDGPAGGQLRRPQRHGLGRSHQPGAAPAGVTAADIVTREAHASGRRWVNLTRLPVLHRRSALPPTESSSVGSGPSKRTSVIWRLRRG